MIGDILKLYWQLFISFFKIGLFTVGGGYAMLPLIQTEVVEKRRWLDNDLFIDGMAIAQSLPGPFAVNTAAFVGYRMRKLPGAITAVAGCTVPSIVIILLIAGLYLNWQDSPIVSHLFAGMRPTVAALVIIAVFSLAKSAKVKGKQWLIPVVVFIGTGIAGISAFYAIIVAIVSGLVWYFLSEPKSRDAE